MSHPAGWGGPLTDRQLEVLKLAAEGKSYTQIGKEMFIGYQTVKTHVHCILVKMGARNMVEAVAIAYKTGMFVPDDVR